MANLPVGAATLEFSLIPIFERDFDATTDSWALQIALASSPHRALCKWSAWRRRSVAANGSGRPLQIQDSCDIPYVLGIPHDRDIRLDRDNPRHLGGPEKCSR